MDLLTRLTTQMRDLFASMTPAARITSTLLLGVIVVSLGYLFQGYSNGSKEYLFNGEMLLPREANDVEAALSSAKLKGWVREGGRILVPRGNKEEFLAAIADAGALPANFDKLLEQSLDLGPFVSEPTRQARMKAARERQLSMIVRMMDGVADAHVLYDLREARGFEPGQATATVSVQPTPGEGLTPQRMKVIRSAVAGAIMGMSPKNVTILDLSNGAQFNGDAMSGANFDDPYFQTRTNYEQMMEARILDLLHDIHGVRVKVSAELSPTLSAQVEAHKAEGEPAALRLSTETNETTNTQVDDRGRPGLTSQGPGRTPPEEAVAKNESKQTNDATETENFVPTTIETRHEAGLVPEHVRASIAIPSEFLDRVWHERFPDKTADERPQSTDLTALEQEFTRKIESLVTPLFPRELGEDIYPNVKVTVFQSLTPAKLEPPSTVSTALAWASQNSGSLIMAALTLFALLMVRSLMKSIPPAETNVVLAPSMQAAAGFAGASAGAAGVALAPDTLGEGAATGGGNAGSPRAGGGGKRRLQFKKGVSMKDDLTEIVREDPDAAAAILRSWIGSAG